MLIGQCSCYFCNGRISYKNTASRSEVKARFLYVVTAKSCNSQKSFVFEIGQFKISRMYHKRNSANLCCDSHRHTRATVRGCYFTLTRLSRSHILFELSLLEIVLKTLESIYGPVLYLQLTNLHLHTVGSTLKTFVGYVEPFESPAKYTTSQFKMAGLIIFVENHEILKQLDFYEPLNTCTQNIDLKREEILAPEILVAS